MSIKNMPTLSVPIAIVVAGMLIAGGLYMGLGSMSKENAINDAASERQVAGPQVSPTPTAVKVDPADINLENEPYLGNPDAKVQLVYYGDFQCPFCKRFETNALPRIKKNYLDTGKAVLYFKNFQFLGPDSTTAGVAGECLIKQLAGNFAPYWQWHNAMYENQDAENSGWGKAGDIKSLVRDLKLSGIDMAEFEGCLDSQETLSEVTADTSEGRNEGVQGTPGVLVNGELVVGAQPFIAFQQIIEKYLE